MVKWKFKRTELLINHQSTEVLLFCLMNRKGDMLHTFRLNNDEMEYFCKSYISDFKFCKDHTCDDWDLNKIKSYIMRRMK